MAGSNFLSPVEFRMSINRLPETRFYVQTVNLPGLNTSSVDYPTPFKNLPIPASKLEYEELQLNLIADENLSAFREISNWLTSLHFTENFDQFKDLKASDEGLISDLTIFVLDSNKNANIAFKFKGVFPISISGIEMNTTESDVNPPTFSVQFKYDSYEIEV